MTSFSSRRRCCCEALATGTEWGVPHFGQAFGTPFSIFDFPVFDCSFFQFPLVAVQVHPQADAVLIAHPVGLALEFATRVYFQPTRLHFLAPQFFGERALPLGY